MEGNPVKKIFLAAFMFVTIIPTIVIQLRKHNVKCNKKPEFIEL